MSTMKSDEPAFTDRESVILSNAERRYLRRKLKGSMAATGEVLNPRKQLRRLIERKSTDVKQFVGETAYSAKRHAPMIGIVGASALLFAARGPISRWISSLRQSKNKTPNGK
ncbi:MAG: hypothetical protein B7Y44_03130 [Sphingomonadales bacterium 28-55-16]|nr:MAG: hypothetical protein B7Y44_03130 [Sphingomonadales bacterium 28-55-16]